MFTLIFSDDVNNDIISAIHYIKNELEAPMAAKNHYEELEKVYLKLEKNPYRRPLVQDKYLAMKGYRSINVKNYVLFYRIVEDNNTVLLIRFMYSQRDWVSILSNE